MVAIIYRAAEDQTARGNSKIRKDKKVSKCSRNDSPKHLKNSPWDQINRKVIRIENLDLDKAHDPPPNAVLHPPHVKRPARHQRWRHTGRDPITEIADLPEGWSMTEPTSIHGRRHPFEQNGTRQLTSSSDLKGQIERCYERIQVRIMPQAFVYRLERLLEAKNQSDQIASRGPTGLQRRSSERWRALAKMKRVCIRKGDPNNQMTNMCDLLDAYELKRLEWNGLIT
ncbi:hypothetical protein N7492_004415 [Penicillium capsulatum]|uniref:Uncharacterized protein n=1 Tax=Penicillium capsulatum TaxID=69766 RepID=A0A9W9LQ69_9EURO|nr:hypothetical protein N7492_004415 [Penicillium capsulatum]KAJ6136464.1 hypothetical protein N7512_001624 [Penicillium capsulatum]